MSGMSMKSPRWREEDVVRDSGGKFDVKTHGTPEVSLAVPSSEPEIVPWEVRGLRPGMKFQTLEHLPNGPLNFQLNRDKELRRRFREAGYPETLTVIDKRRWEFDRSETVVVVDLDGEPAEFILHPDRTLNVVIEDQDEFDKLFV